MHAANLPLSTIANFTACCRDALALELTDQPGTYRIVRATCKSKWCVGCAARRAARIRGTLATAMENRQIRLITLTLRHSNQPLKPQLKRLTKAFRRLRTLANWNNRVSGGAFFVELTRDPTGQSWHPHLHIIAQGLYYDHADLKRDWLRVTGDSSIVHITLVRDHRSIGSYVTKYLTKPIDSATYANDQDLAEAIAAFHAHRTIGTFGSWQKLKLLQPPPQQPAKLVGWIAELRVKAADGDQLARRLCQVYDEMPATALAVEVQLPPIVSGRIDELEDHGPWDYAEQPSVLLEEE